jgi:hypothetical protein
LDIIKVFGKGRRPSSHLEELRDTNLIIDIRNSQGVLNSEFVNERRKSATELREFEMKLRAKGLPRFRTEEEREKQVIYVRAWYLRLLLRKSFIVWRSLKAFRMDNSELVANSIRYAAFCFKQAAGMRMFEGGAGGVDGDAGPESNDSSALDADGRLTNITNSGLLVPGIKGFETLKGRVTGTGDQREQSILLRYKYRILNKTRIDNSIVYCYSIDSRLMRNSKPDDDSDSICCYEECVFEF